MAKKELRERGFKVKALAMPDTIEIEKWVFFLKKRVPKPDKNTYFVAHSIGCQAVLRYLERTNGKAGGIVFVAPWFHLKNLSHEEKQIAK
ncbi:MAG: alpha/beta hydrolase [Candidatus Pacearchaeota archaeon]|nr:alpha/beta hydrolase [Candidatus Pacearchaeota archaeon]